MQSNPSLTNTKTNKRNARRKTQNNLSKVKSMVKSMIQKDVESKYFDQSLALGAVIAGNIYNISDITRGDDVTQRIGNEVCLKNITLRVSTSINTVVQKAMIRFLLVLDKQGYNAPSVSDIIEPGLLSTTYTDIAPYHWDYKRRFKILHDEVIPMNLGGSNGYSHRVIHRKLGYRSNYIGAATTFTNQLLLVILGSEVNVLAISSFQYHSRIEFTDE